MFTNNNSKPAAEPLLAGDEENSQVHEMTPVQGTGGIQHIGDSTPRVYTRHRRNAGRCSWKCCCLSTLFILTVALVVLLLTLFISVAPKFAQTTLDNASMDIINGSIYNPTNDSITLDTAVMLSNTGMVDGELSAHTATVTVDGIEIGTMPMPVLNTVANQNVIIALSSVLSITNKTQFQKTCGELLQNIDQTWHLSGRGVTLSVDTGFMTKEFTVNVEKDLVLKAAKLYNFIASDMDVTDATTAIVESVSNLNFISDSVFEFNLPKTLMHVYFDDVYIGYAPLESLSMKPGLNSITNQHIIIEKTSENQDKLDEFFSNYLHGTDQEVFMKGPVVSKGYDSLVIDGIFEQSVTSLGYKKGDLAFGGLLTSGTQQGWTVDGKTLRGAYSNFLNPLSVPVRITYVHGVVTMKETIKYHVILVTHAVERDCEATQFAQLYTGRGIYKNEPNKTWVDVDANARATYFAIVDPPEGQFEGNCVGQYPFDCCFATLSAAYACYLNPGIQSVPSSGELSSNYMPLSLEANVTILVNNAFEVTTHTSQDFLPLYFGKNIYAGYAADLNLNCKRFTFK